MRNRRHLTPFYAKLDPLHKAFLFSVIMHMQIMEIRDIRKTPSCMLSALITSTEAAIDAAQEALALTMALAVADLVDLNIFGVSFRLLCFVYDGAILAPYNKPVNSK